MNNNRLTLWILLQFVSRECQCGEFSGGSVCEVSTSKCEQEQGEQTVN